MAKKKTTYEAWSDLGKAINELFKSLIEELERLAEKVSRYLNERSGR